MHISICNYIHNNVCIYINTNSQYFEVLILIIITVIFKRYFSDSFYPFYKKQFDIELRKQLIKKPNT